MLKLLRIALLLVIAFLMLTGVVIGLGTTGTGPIEKAVLVVYGGMLLVAAVKVNSIGRPAVR